MLWSINACIGAYYERYFERQSREVVENREHAELVIFGSSYANFGINPKYLEPLGYRVYNFATTAASPSYYLEWYQRIFRPYYDRPRVIVYQADWFVFGGSIRSRKFEDDSQYLPWRVFFECLSSDQYDRFHLFIRRFPILKFRDEFESWRRERPRMIKELDGYYKGFMPLSNVPNSADDIAPINWDPDTFAKNMDDFERLLDEFQKDGAMVVLVQVPNYLPAFMGDKRLQNVMTSQNRNIAQIAKKRGIIFLNYNEERASKINESYELFAEAHHLNGEGAKRFTIVLEKDLSHILPPLRPASP